MNVRDKLDLLPLRQMVIAAGEAAPVFARQPLLDWLSRPDRYQIIRHCDGGQILAANEHALAEARTVLRQAYGALVTFAAPAVHSYMDCDGEVPMVPIIFLRIDAPRAHAQELQRRLAERCASMKEVDLQRDRVVLRAEMEMCRALGFARKLEELTGGAAHLVSWLVRYDRAWSQVHVPPVVHR
jgi:hypothetical protein